MLHGFWVNRLVADVKEKWLLGLLLISLRFDERRGLVGKNIRNVAFSLDTRVIFKQRRIVVVPCPSIASQ